MAAGPVAEVLAGFDHNEHLVRADDLARAEELLLAAGLAQRLGATFITEKYDENPFLADFYQDMPRWSFQSQVFFLSRRLRQHNSLLKYKKSVIQDRSVYEDAEIFARNLYVQGNMTERDYDAYRNIYKAVSAFLPPPHLIVYLEASVERLVNHIERRGRDFERNISPDYLRQLNSLYDDWINDWTACPVLRIPMDGIDFCQNPDDLVYIENEVERALSVRCENRIKNRKSL